MPPSSVFPNRFSAALASTSALRTFERHWPDYCREATGLAGFVQCAGSIATLLENSGSPVNEAIASMPPPLAMLLATEVYRRARPGSIARLPHYPVSVETP